MRRAAEHEDEPPAATQQVCERRALGVRDRRLEREAEVRRLQPPAAARHARAAGLGRVEVRLPRDLAVQAVTRRLHK